MEKLRDGERHQGKNRKDASGRSDERPVGHEPMFLVRRRRDIRLEG